MSRQVYFPDHPSDMDRARIVIVPAPYDGTSTWIKGADKGPRAIMEASKHLEDYDIETGTEVWQQGIATDIPVTECDTPEAMVQAVQNRVGHHLQQGKYPVVLGGEHSVSIGSVRAHADHYDNLTVLQLDAHTDLRDSYCGSPYNHACVMARIQEDCPIVQVGIRSMDQAERVRLDPGRVFYAKDCVTGRAWIDSVIGKLSDRIYITLDLDVFDPAIVPSTGTPEPGGLLWYDVLALLKAVCANCQVVGFDVVELCPNPLVKTPDFLAAKLVYQLLSLEFSKR
jgi:agmatinase